MIVSANVVSEDVAHIYVEVRFSGSNLEQSPNEVFYRKEDMEKKLGVAVAETNKTSFIFT